MSGKNKAVDLSEVSAVQKYVKALAEQAATQLDDGLIVPSPYEGTCAYCEFSAICGQKFKERKVSGVDTEFIAESARCAESQGENKDGKL